MIWPLIFLNVLPYTEHCVPQNTAPYFSYRQPSGAAHHFPVTSILDRNRIAMADSTDHHAVLPTLASKIETAQAGISTSSGLSPGHLNLIATRLSYEASPSEASHPPFSSFAPSPSIWVRRITRLDLRTLTTTVLHCRYLVLAADYLAATAVIGAYPPTRVPRLLTACLTFPHGWVMYAICHLQGGYDQSSAGSGVVDAPGAVALAASPSTYVPVRHQQRGMMRAPIPPEPSLFPLPSLFLKTAPRCPILRCSTRHQERVTITKLRCLWCCRCFR